MRLQRERRQTSRLLQNRRYDTQTGDMYNMPTGLPLFLFSVQHLNVCLSRCADKKVALRLIQKCIVTRVCARVLSVCLQRGGSSGGCQARHRSHQRQSRWSVQHSSAQAGSFFSLHVVSLFIALLQKSRNDDWLAAERSASCCAELSGCYAASLRTIDGAGIAKREDVFASIEVRSRLC